jgi:hypothetical protein
LAGNCRIRRPTRVTSTCAGATPHCSRDTTAASRCNFCSLFRPPPDFGSIRGSMFASILRHFPVQWLLGVVSVPPPAVAEQPGQHVRPQPSRLCL